MKTYFFNSRTNEYKISAKNLPDALEQLVVKLVSDNEVFHVAPYYYCDGARKIPARLYDKYLLGYSF